MNGNKKFKWEDLETYIRYKAHTMGVKLVYAALLLFYAYWAKDTPKWAKNIVIGALAYFLSPIDAIPDLSPFIGFTDDFGILSFSMVAIACYIDKDVRIKARKRLNRFFKKVDDQLIEEVDAII